MYATVADLRAEGVTASQASDERLNALLDEASYMIDRATGWFFEPRALTYHLDGRGAPSVEPPAPPIRLDRLAVDGTEIAILDIIVAGAPVPPRFAGPHLTLRHGRRFPRGRDNIEATGLWGYTEHDGSATGGTPREIRRACMMSVLRVLPPLADVDAAEDARSRWRVVAERTREQGYTLARPGEAGPFTGDPDIDRILLRYRRPSAMGAA